jgi:V/A-type H+-transporting ATPase subunit D
MARLPLNKSTLSKKKQDLKTYRRFLPSLDMKRKQLLAERNKARVALNDLQSRRARLRSSIEADLPMLSNQGVALENLVRVQSASIGEANIVGVLVPTFEAVRIDVQAYGLLAKPHWVDGVVKRLREALELHLREQVARERLKRLEAGLTKVTQRVNLFEKVLIPRTEEEIKRIDIALQDSERAAVVRAKVAKRKTAAGAAGAGTSDRGAAA